jgi:formamidopyrimidine-DNA glycosylase
MPELPEVELIASTLNSFTAERQIRYAKLLERKLAPDETAKTFARKLSNSRVNNISRRGKHLLIHLNSAQTLIVHLRMTGTFSFHKHETARARHTRAIFHFGDDSQLHFEDQRKFALMKIVATQSLFETKELCDLAPEPFGDEFTYEYLRDVLSKSKRNIKELLLDQTKVCGLGNIYAAEALFRARIHPQKPARKISKKKIAALHSSIRETLSEAMRKSSRQKIQPEKIDSYFFNGDNNGHWFVYDTEGNPCANCAAKIRRIVQGNRSTYFCPKCQRA